MLYDELKRELLVIRGYLGHDEQMSSADADLSLTTLVSRLASNVNATQVQLTLIALALAKVLDDAK